MTIPSDYWVTVCDSCLTASCWHGEFMCEQSCGANIATLKASELCQMKREHEDNYSREKLLQVCGQVNEVR